MVTFLSIVSFREVVKYSSLCSIKICQKVYCYIEINRTSPRLLYIHQNLKTDLAYLFILTDRYAYDTYIIHYTFISVRLLTIIN